ncbi:CRISPR-associated protein [Haemophilus sp. HMSC71H05]|nr:TIGR02584 family CRISPR-associated protein [Haemophilus parainfluenzae]OHR70438.1 CRISPR-associated protein [Haemophilus sp. HMSC71H05]
MMSQKRKILLSVTGMSPAVVTETLYALVTEKGFIPTEIQVITTEQGKNKLLEALLGIEGGRKERKGALQEFIEDYGEKYGFSSIHFDESCIHIITNERGQNLPDIRTPEENEHAANSIVQLVGNLCQDEEMQLHVSIAGGRKTMGFFMGYALSLYGREQDSLSHVLVDSQYESLASFYYPKPYPHLINKNDGTQIDAKDGKVMLAEIPWVRLGLGVPEDLKQQTISYSDSVKNAQALLDMPSLTFLSPMEERGVMFGTKLLKLAPRGYALLLSLVLAKKQGWNVGTGNREEARTIATYLNIYSQMKNDVEMENRLKGANNDLKNVLSESRTDINKKVMANFSLGKGARSDYIPSSNRKTGNYELNINLDNIDISEIESELIHFNLL